MIIGLDLEVRYSEANPLNYHVTKVRGPKIFQCPKGYLVTSPYCYLTHDGSLVVLTGLLHDIITAKDIIPFSYLSQISNALCLCWSKYKKLNHNSRSPAIFQVKIK